MARALARIRTAYRFHAIDRVGRDAVVIGNPHFSNQGRIEIGDDFFLVARPATSHLVTLPQGSIRIGDRVHIERGASISSLLEVRIGDDVQMGSFVVIMDSDFHVVGNRDLNATPQPVRIGNGVVIGHRVTILRGSAIGDGARIENGSVVSGEVPPGAVVAGVPARPVSSDSVAGDGGSSVRALVQQIFGLRRLPSTADGPDTISNWDSLGALKLILAIEQSFGATLGDAELRSVRTIGELEEIVTASMALGAAAAREPSEPGPPR